MLSEDRLVAFTTALTARSGAAAVGATDPAPAHLPADVARLLARVGGRSFDDVKFATMAEAAKAPKDAAASAMWNPEWRLVATTETELYAYDPMGCFRSRRGQVVALGREGARRWHVFPTLDFWLGALEHGAADREDARASNAARDWAEARGRLGLATVPEGASEVSFDLPLEVVSHLGGERMEVGFDLFVAYTLSRGRDAGRALEEMARALDASVPYCQLRRLEEVGAEDASALVPWFDALLTKQATKKGVTRLLFGQASLAGGLGFWAWPAAANEEPGFTQRNVSATRAFDRLAKVSDEAKLGYSTERWRFAAALLTFVVRDLLEACAARLPFAGELDVHVEGRLVGRVDTDGFVPTPLPIVESQGAATRDSTTRGLQAMGFPGKPPEHAEHPVPKDASAPRRTLRHSDGRSVEVLSEGGKWTCTTVEADGERDTFSRPTKTGWEAETFIAAQRRSGFTEE